MLLMICLNLNSTAQPYVSDLNLLQAFLTFPSCAFLPHSCYYREAAVCLLNAEGQQRVRLPEITPGVL